LAKGLGGQKDSEKKKEGGKNRPYFGGVVGKKQSYLTAHINDMGGSFGGVGKGVEGEEGEKGPGRDQSLSCLSLRQEKAPRENVFPRFG